MRKRLQEIRNVINNANDAGEFDDTVEEKEFFQNERVREVYDKFGPFKTPIAEGVFVEKGPFRLRSGAIYIG